MASMAAATSGFVVVHRPFTGRSATATSRARFDAPILFLDAKSNVEESPASGVPWVDEQIRRIAVLRSNWDGYGAEPIARVRLEQIAGVVAEHFKKGGLPTGSIVPGADGSVQMEWHYPRSSFGLVIESSGAFYAWQRLRESNEYYDAEGVHAVTLLEAAVLQALA